MPISAFRPLLRQIYPSMSSASRAAPRLALISRHLDQSPFLELNTPFSTERSAPLEADVEYQASKPAPSRSTSKGTQTQPPKEQEKPAKMSNQEPHPALLIPGPIEFDDAVLSSMSHYRYPHIPHPLPPLPPASPNNPPQ